MATNGSYGDPDRIEAASQRCGNHNELYGDSDQIEVRASVGASAARDERAGQRPERRRLRPHTCAALHHIVASAESQRGDLTGLAPLSFRVKAET